MWCLIEIFIWVWNINHQLQSKYKEKNKILLLKPIEINIDTDIQDLKLAINDCLDYPSKETAWSNLDDLLTQQGLSKYLTTEQSISIIDTFYNHFQIQPLCSDSVLCAIKVCLKKCNEYIPPEIINFL